MHHSLLTEVLKRQRGLALKEDLTINCELSGVKNLPGMTGIPSASIETTCIETAMDRQKVKPVTRMPGTEVSICFRQQN
ncbi:hypothetical protein [Endozoicomonas sp. 8E]|uniref:hypothetical protein n=1 Tax=Endozoicomonas sp. 8E TaxID=3035692 RepID=UPI002938ED0E|nr:hypothetical protein [Endozoicomonas sp. 8E]WOG29357.1 hypothetical protein P6910_06805 [Endozoicomonas sp. 8E]